MRSLVFIVSSLIFLGVQAKTLKQLEAEGLVIKEGTVVEVQAFDSKNKTFELMIVKEPGVGPNIATTKSLSRATGTDEKKLKEHVGSELTLKKKLILLSNDEIEKMNK